MGDQNVPPECSNREYWWWGRPRRGVWLNRGNSWAFWDFPLPMAKLCPVNEEWLAPHRIRDAFDDYDLGGNWVDRAVGATPPKEVDQWELGELVPTVGQMRRVAWLTQRPLDWFYPDPATLQLGHFCMRSKSAEARKYLIVEMGTTDERGE